MRRESVPPVVEKERKNAYQRKISVVSDCLGRIPENPEQASRLEMDGILHNVQVMIDACMDLAAMLVKDQGHEVSDDYDNLEKLGETGFLSPQLAATMGRLNGMRNAIVHRYNSFEEEVLLRGLDTIQSAVLEFAEAMEGML